MWILLLLLLTSPAIATDRWDRTDKILLVTSTAFQAVDLMQTTHIAKNPQDHSEMNLIIGNHPTVGQVRAMFAIGFAIRVTGAVILPSRYRKYWLGTFCVISGASVVWNFSNGIGISW